MPGEYVAKTMTKVKDKSTIRKVRNSVGDGLSSLFEEELRVIMEMWGEKIAKKKGGRRKTGYSGNNRVFPCSVQSRYGFPLGLRVMEEKLQIIFST